MGATIAVTERLYAEACERLDRWEMGYLRAKLVWMYEKQKRKDGRR